MDTLRYGVIVVTESRRLQSFSNLKYESAVSSVYLLSYKHITLHLGERVLRRPRRVIYLTLCKVVGVLGIMRHLISLRCRLQRLNFIPELLTWKTLRFYTYNIDILPNTPYELTRLSRFSSMCTRTTVQP